MKTTTQFSSEENISPVKTKWQAPTFVIFETESTQSGISQIGENENESNIIS